MNLGGFRVPKLQCDVPRDAPVRVLIYTRWDQAWDRLPRPFRLKETWGGLDGWEKHDPSICLLPKPKHGSDGATGDPPSDLQRYRV